MQDIKEIALSPALSAVLRDLPSTGVVKLIANGFAYLDIDDRYIHNIYPLLDYPHLVKPDYFSESANYMGAHISIVYPEEKIRIPSSEENKTINFTVTGLFIADILNKRYYALKVNAPGLLDLRRNYQLADKLQLRDHLLDLHITVANSYLPQK